jgi:hypothetical protein
MMMEDRSDVEAAVRWWVDQLRGLPKFDNGDKSERGGFTAMLSMMASANTPTLSDEQLEQFEVALDAEITEQLEKCGSAGVHVDYGPDVTLQKACKVGGFSGDSRFPCKTNMWVYPGLVRLSHGYGAPVQDIFVDERGWRRIKDDSEKQIKYYSNMEPDKWATEEQIAGWKQQHIDNLAKAEEQLAGA